MYDPIPGSEIRNITFQENIEEIPEDEITEKLMEWDENTHLSDYPGEVEIDVHYTEEYIELRRIGLTHPEAEGVINHVE